MSLEDLSKEDVLWAHEMEIGHAKAEIERLEAENAALRERLEKAVELREPRITVDHWGGIYEVVYEKVQVVSEVYDIRLEAEARVAELKGEKECAKT